MAEDGVKQPLLQDCDPPSNVGERKPPQGVGAKRFRRCRTAPSADGAQDPPPGRHDPSHQDQSASAGGSPPFEPPKELLQGPRPSFRLVGVLLLAYLLAGTIAFYLAMGHMSGDRTGRRVVDALYFCVVTMTTVGYGDLVPASDAAKLLACAFVFAGVALVGTFLSKAADYLVEKQEALLFRALHLRRAGDRRALRDMEANKVRYKLYTSAALLAAMLASGTAFLVEVEGMRPVDAFYCVCATVTTLGYGDQSFSSVGGRAFAAAWITVSTVVVALFFLYAAELGAERRQRALARWVLKRRTGITASGPRTSCCTSLRSWGRSARRRSPSSWRSSTSSTPTTPAPSRRTTSSWRSPVSMAIPGSQQGGLSLTSQIPEHSPISRSRAEHSNVHSPVARILLPRDLFSTVAQGCCIG